MCFGDKTVTVLLCLYNDSTGSIRGLVLHALSSMLVLEDTNVNICS